MSAINKEWRHDAYRGQFIGHPQTFVELQLRFKLHFYTKKMKSSGFKVLLLRVQYNKVSPKLDAKCHLYRVEQKKMELS